MERVPIPWILTEAQQVNVCCSALRKLSPAVDNTTHTKSFASLRDDFLFALYHPSYRELREHGHNVPYDKRKKLEESSSQAYVELTGAVTWCVKRKYFEAVSKLIFLALPLHSPSPPPPLPPAPKSLQRRRGYTLSFSQLTSDKNKNHRRQRKRRIAQFTLDVESRVRGKRDDDTESPDEISEHTEDEKILPDQGWSRTHGLASHFANNSMPSTGEEVRRDLIRVLHSLNVHTDDSWFEKASTPDADQTALFVDYFKDKPVLLREVVSKVNNFSS